MRRIAMYPPSESTQRQGAERQGAERQGTVTKCAANHPINLYID